MKEAAQKRRRFGSTSGSDSDYTSKSPKRQATLFDVVAGRVSTTGFIPSRPLPTKVYSDLTWASTLPLKPDEVLFKRKDAPERYAETDGYLASDQLDLKLTLPSADLLGSLHAYIAKHYAYPLECVSTKVWKSMDETALLAIGILVEEAAMESLGHNGDMVFIEAEVDDVPGKEKLSNPVTRTATMSD